MVENPTSELAIFRVAFSIESEDLREAYLQQVCGDDRKLRKRVTALLKANQDAPGFLEPPAREVAPTIDTGPITEQPGMTIGRYKLLQEVGEGGFGVVYMAEQREPVRRKVALKIIKPGMDTRQVVARFEAERQALALMDHPNVAHVLDGGATESGRPYFVMELVRGMPITQYCDEAKLTTDERLQLFISVCDAVQHAHQKGIIHRDIKPSNVLVTLHGETPVPKIIDFGVAKATHQQLTEKTVFTGVGQMIGTPLYMSPEQLAISGLDVDTRSDIYSLGVLLYELLSGVPPFDKDRFHEFSVDEIRRTIREEEPPRPSERISTLAADATSTISINRKTDTAKLSQSLRGELDWIVMRAMEKDRARRYESVRDLAKDVQRHLDGVTVEACPPSAVYRLRKFAQRNKAIFATVTAVAVSLFLGTGIATWQSVRATRAFGRENIARKTAEQQREQAVNQRNVARAERTEAIRQRNIAYRNLYYSDIAVMQRDWQHGQVHRMVSLLDRHLPEPGRPEMRGWEWFYLRSLPHRNNTTFASELGTVYCVRWSPDGTRLATGSLDGFIRIWDSDTRREALKLRSPTRRHPNQRIAWSPDGTLLAFPQEKLVIWDTNSGREMALFEMKAAVCASAWSPDGKHLAIGTEDNVLRIWDSPFDGKPKEVHAHEYGPICAIAWSPDGRQLASGGNDRVLRIWDPKAGREIQMLAGHFPYLYTLDWSPDGRWVASGGYDGRVRVWDATTGAEIASLSHRGGVRAVAWSPDGAYLSSASYDQHIRIWAADTFRIITKLKGHAGDIYAVDWSPDGKLLASGSEDGEVRHWKVDELESDVAVGSSFGVGVQMAWSPDDRFIAYAATDNTIRLRETSTDREILKIGNVPKEGFPILAWSPDGRQLATLGDCRVEVWSVLTGKKLRELPHEGEMRSVDWSPDGKRIASVSRFEDLLKVWDANTGEHLHSVQSRFMALRWSPDGTRLATTGSRVLRVWDAGDWKQLHALQGRSGWALAWSRDGKRIASGGGNPDIGIWDAIAGRELLCLSGHTGAISSVAWSRDGNRVASASRDGTLRIWDAETGQEAMIVYASGEGIAQAAWSHDGMRILLGSPSSLEILDASWAYKNAQPVTPSGGK
jgi:WD40 repeat protein